MTKSGMKKSGAPRSDLVRGVALIEALVALLVMSFGMVAVAGLLGTMRQSADLAKQRGEAMRLAQQEMERIRDYSVVTAVPDVTARDYLGQRDYTNDVAGATRDISAAELGSNTAYQLVRTVTPAVEPPVKAVRVVVSWVDRAAGPLLSVTTDSFIAMADPSLAGSLAIPPQYSATRRVPDGKSILPPGAKDLGDGHSVFKPVTGGTVAFVFDNISGVIISRCTVDAGVSTQSLTASVLATCPASSGFGLWGFVRFANASPLSTANLATSLSASYAQRLEMVIAPSGVSGAPAAPTYECLDDAPVSAADGVTLSQHSVSYFCRVVPSAVSVTTGGTTVNFDAWTGKLNVSEIPVDDGSWKVCRYSGNYDGNATISNAEHPQIYTNVPGALGNQNFLVVKGTESCPTGATGSTGTTFFSTATVQHQPNGVDTPTTVH